VPWTEIVKANGIQNVTKLKVGQKLIIPRITEK
jgi:nucleoid-associated protein YgaU